MHQSQAPAPCLPLGLPPCLPPSLAPGLAPGLSLGARRRYRTVFLSDTHLGTRGSRAEFLAGFLRQVECEHLYLVGDIVDGWRLKKTWYWDAHHDEVLRLILRAARNGTTVTYIPGNHDEMFRAWLGLEVAGVKLALNAVHTAACAVRFRETLVPVVAVKG